MMRSKRILLFHIDGVPVYGPSDPEERARIIGRVLYELARPKIEAILAGETPKDDGDDEQPQP